MENFLIERYRKELTKICKSHNLLLKEEVLSGRRDKYIQKGKCECYCFLRNKGFAYHVIGEAFGVNHAAIIYSIRTHCNYKELLNNT